MSQSRALPDREPLDGIFLEHAPCLAVGDLGTGQGDHHIQLRATSDDEADAAQYTIDIPITSEPVEIHCRAVGGLLQQLFVAHWHSPSLRGQPCTNVVYQTLNFLIPNTIRASVAAQPLIESLLGKAPYSEPRLRRFARGFGRCG